MTYKYVFRRLSILVTALLLSVGCMLASSSPPVVMKVLVLTGNGYEPSYKAITTYLQQIGVPYQATVLANVAPDASGNRLSVSTLEDLASGQGRYQGIILADSTFAQCGPSCLSSADWTTLNTYASHFAVRVVSYFTLPQAQWGLVAADSGIMYTAAAPLSVKLTTAGAAVFPYLKPASSIPVSGQGTSGVLAYMATTVAATNETTTPLLMAGLYTVAATHTTSDGRETLALTMDNSPALLHSTAFGYGVINWVTKGVFLGSRRVYLNPQIDDMLLGNRLYAPTLPACPNDPTCPTLFASAQDIQTLLNWQNKLIADPLFLSFHATYALNGIGETWLQPNDPIVPAIASLGSNFTWLSHTWDHQNLDCYTTDANGACVPATLSQAQAELNQNIAMASQLGINLDLTSVVTPYESGFANPNFITAAAQVGVQYLAGGPNAISGGVVNALNPSIYEIPRTAPNLFTDVSVPTAGVYGSWVDEYNATFGPTGTQPTYSKPLTYTDILDNESNSLLLSNMLTYQPFLLGFHVDNSSTYDNGTHSLFSDLMDATITKYESLFTLPVLTMDMKDLGLILKARGSYDASGVVGVYMPDGSVVLTTTNAATIPVTGVCSPGSSIYGGQCQNSVSIPANSSVTLIPTAAGNGVASVSIDRVQVIGGASSLGTVTLTNPALSGGATIALSSENASVPPSVTVRAGTYSASFAITTAPVTSATTATITATYNGGFQTATLTVMPAITLSSVTLNPNSVTGTTTSNGTVTLSGPAPTGGISIALSSSDPSATVPASVIVPAGSSTATFTINSTLVNSSVTAVITATYSGVSKTAALTEIGQAPPSITLSAHALTFNLQTTGTTSGSQSLIITNSGTQTVSVPVIGLSPNIGDFIVSGTCTATLVQGASCQLNVAFKPTTIGSRNATLTVTSNAAAQSVALSGTGQAPAPPSITIPSPASLTYTGQPTGTTSSAQVITISNSGTTDVSLTSIGLDGPNANDYNIVGNTCNSDLAVGTTCNVSVTFTPSATGPRIASLVVTSNATGSPLDVALNGVGALPVPCEFTLSSSSQPYPAAGALDSFVVTTTSSCSWTASTSASWIKITGSTSGTGLTTVPFTVDPNTTGPARTGTISVGNQTATIVQGQMGLRFVPMTPCRVVDTRLANGPFGGPIMGAGTSRDFQLPSGPCGIPATAQAYAVNLTVVPTGVLGFLSAWPAGQPQPSTSVLNSDGRIKANAAIIAAGANGAISIYASHATHVVIDISGYFVPSTDVSGLAFYPLTPCRVADTRNAPGPLGQPYLQSFSPRNFPVLSSTCGIPSAAKAYSMNFTVVPRGPSVGVLSAWPAGQPQQVVSTLNDFQGTVVANAAIVQAGTNGDISVYTSDPSEVIIDVNGYFAPPQAGGLSLYTMTPCRALDTRSGGGAPLNGTMTQSMFGLSQCSVPTQAQAFVLNATVVPEPELGVLTLWPSGSGRAIVSTLNAFDGAVTSNMSIVPGTNGSVNAYTSNPAHLILDMSGYFAPEN